MNLKKARYLRFFLILAILIVPLVNTNQYNLHLIVLAVIYAIVATGLNLVVGYAGDLSLAHAGFYAIGGYVSALMSLRLGVSFWFGVIGAIIIAGCISYIVGLISLRVRGSAFVIMTVSFAGIVHLVLLNWVELTQGQMGLSSIPHPSIWGFVIDTRMEYYYLVLVFLGLTLYIVNRLVNSKIGRAWTATRENEALANSLGISAYKYALLAFVIGSALAALGGSLYAHYIEFISPELALFGNTIIFLVMVIMGGKGTVYGPIIGAVIFTILPEYLRIAENLRLSIFGLLLIILVLYMPAGLLPTFSALRKKRKRVETIGVKGKEEITNANS